MGKRGKGKAAPAKGKSSALKQTPSQAKRGAAASLPEPALIATRGRSRSAVAAKAGTPDRTATKRKASPSPAPKAAPVSAKKGRMASESPAPAARRESRGRAATAVKEKPTAAPAPKRERRSASVKKEVAGRVTRAVVEEVEKKSTRSASTPKQKDTPKLQDTPTQKDTPKQKGTPKQKDTPKPKDTPKQKITPKRQTVTPKAKAATPVRASRTPSRSTPGRLKETPKQQVIQKTKAATPKQKPATPKTKVATPKAATKQVKNSTPVTKAKKSPQKSPQKKATPKKVVSQRSPRKSARVATSKDSEDEEMEENEDPIATTEKATEEKDTEKSDAEMEVDTTEQSAVDTTEDVEEKATEETVDETVDEEKEPVEAEGVEAEQVTDETEDVEADQETEEPATENEVEAKQDDVQEAEGVEAEQDDEKDTEEVEQVESEQVKEVEQVEADEEIVEKSDDEAKEGDKDVGEEIEAVEAEQVGDDAEDEQPGEEEAEDVEAEQDELDEIEQVEADGVQTIVESPEAAEVQMVEPVVADDVQEIVESPEAGEMEMEEPVVEQVEADEVQEIVESSETAEEEHVVGQMEADEVHEIVDSPEPAEEEPVIEEVVNLDENEEVISLDSGSKDSTDVVELEATDLGVPEAIQAEVIDVNEDDSEVVLIDEGTTYEQPGPIIEEISDTEDGSGDRAAIKKSIPTVEEISEDEDVEDITESISAQGQEVNDDANLTGIEIGEEAQEDEEMVETSGTAGQDAEYYNGEYSTGKRKHEELEEDEDCDEVSLKKAKTSTEVVTNSDYANGEKSEDISKDYVVIDINDVPPSESQAVIDSAPIVLSVPVAHQDSTEITQINESGITEQTVTDNQIADTIQTDSNPVYNRSFIPNPAFTSTDLSKQFSVVSYNVLGDCHLFRNDYSFTDGEYLQAEYRLANLVAELKYLDADVVCLQEVDPEFFANQLLPTFKGLGYDGFHKKRTEDFFHEGEATFYRTSRFTLVDVQTYRVADLFEQELHEGVEASVQERVREYMDLADILVVAKLKCSVTGQQVTVGNIHVVWAEMKKRDAQCVQIASAIKEIVRTAGSESCPHILCGDFNSEPQSPGYVVARDGYPNGDETIIRLQEIKGIQLPDGETSSLVNSIWPAFQHTSSVLKSAYFETQGSEPSVTSYNRVMCDCVDYIFYSSSSLDSVGVLEVASRDSVVATGGIPNIHFPSDHVSMKALLSFK